MGPRESNSINASSSPSDESGRRILENLRPLNKMPVLKKSKYALVTETDGKRFNMILSGTTLKSIKHLQRSTHMLIPRKPFSQVVREVTQDHGNFRYSVQALQALQEAAEHFLVQYLSDSYELTRHRSRETLSGKDCKAFKSLFKKHMPCLQGQTF